MMIVGRRNVRLFVLFDVRDVSSHVLQLFKICVSHMCRFLYESHVTSGICMLQLLNFCIILLKGNDKRYNQTKLNPKEGLVLCIMHEEGFSCLFCHLDFVCDKGLDTTHDAGMETARVFLP